MMLPGAAFHPLSRRQLLVGAGCAFALGRIPAYAALAPPPPVQGAADSTTRLTLETRIDGQGPFRFVVDTGADRSVIAADVAATLGLLPNENVVVQGIARALPAPTVPLKNLAFGTIALDCMAAPVLSRKWLGADGFLGLDVIDGRRVTFDFQNHRLTVAPSAASTNWTHFNEVVVRVDGSKGRLRAVDCTVQDVPAIAFIDSGAQISICNTPLFDRLKRVGVTAVQGANIPLMGATGGQVQGQLTSVSSIRLGKLLFGRSRLAVSDLDVFKLWNLTEKPALFIGMDFLQQMASFTIDYGHKELRFKLANALSRRRWERFAAL